MTDHADAVRVRRVLLVIFVFASVWGVTKVGGGWAGLTYVITLAVIGIRSATCKLAATLPKDPTQRPEPR